MNSKFPKCRQKTATLSSFWTRTKSKASRAVTRVSAVVSHVTPHIITIKTRHGTIHQVGRLRTSIYASVIITCVVYKAATQALPRTELLFKSICVQKDSLYISKSHCPLIQGLVYAQWWRSLTLCGDEGLFQELQWKLSPRLQTDRNLVLVPKLAIFLASVMAVIVKHGFGLLSVTAETTKRLRHEPNCSC